MKEGTFDLAILDNHNLRTDLLLERVLEQQLTAERRPVDETSLGGGTNKFALVVHNIGQLGRLRLVEKILESGLSVVVLTGNASDVNNVISQEARRLGVARLPYSTDPGPLIHWWKNPSAARHLL